MISLLMTFSSFLLIIHGQQCGDYDGLLQLNGVNTNIASFCASSFIAGLISREHHHMYVPIHFGDISVKLQQGPFASSTCLLVWLTSNFIGCPSQ